MLLKILNSRRFIWFIVGIFVIQAVWIAFSGRYPMAFDENVHFGITGLYTKHISPFWSSQPAGADVFGVVFRDPSFLYHYLMSFLLRGISSFTDSLYAQVIVLRLVNVAMFAAGIYVFWLLLQKFKASLPIVHGVLLFFVLIPVVPLLGGQINYDNLLFPLVGLTFLLSLNFLKGIQKTKLSLATTFWLIVVFLLASLVKYAYLPILLAVGLVLILGILSNRTKIPKITKSLTKQLKNTKKLYIGLGVLLLLCLSVVFVERYAVNLAKYHRPAPECQKALSVSSCSLYGPWLRDYNFAKTNPVVNQSPIKYTNKWLKGMWSRLYFAVDGPGTYFDTKGPLYFPAVSALVISGLGLLALIIKLPAVIKKYDRTAIIITSVSFGFYIVSLWLEEFKAYIKTGVPVAINGRYLIPVIIPIALITVLAINELLGQKRVIKQALLILSILAIAYGGGAMTYIIRGDERWYWPNSPISSTNLFIKNNIGPYIYGFYNRNQFLP